MGAVAGAARAGKAAQVGEAGAPKKAAAKKTAPVKAARPPSSKGLMDAYAAGDRKKTEPAPTPPADTPPTPSPAPPAVPEWAGAGAGFVLALMFWTWVALPFLKGGPQGVKAMIKAKFTNKALDGSWLP